MLPFTNFFGTRKRKRHDSPPPSTTSDQSLPHDSTVGPQCKEVENTTVQFTEQSSTIQRGEHANEIFTARSTGQSSDKASKEKLFPSGQVYGLQVLYTPPNPLIDVIFVHGLTGNSYKTWLEDKSGTYWPVHLLTKSVPEARIMTFGYDADVGKFLSPVSQNNLNDHALSLIGDLATLRDGDRSVRQYHCIAALFSN